MSISRTFMKNLLLRTGHVLSAQSPLPGWGLWRATSHTVPRIQMPRSTSVWYMVAAGSIPKLEIEIYTWKRIILRIHCRRCCSYVILLIPVNYHGWWHYSRRWCLCLHPKLRANLYISDLGFLIPLSPLQLALFSLIPHDSSGWCLYIQTLMISFITLYFAEVSLSLWRYVSRCCLTDISLLLNVLSASMIVLHHIDALHIVYLYITEVLLDLRLPSSHCCLAWVTLLPCGHMCLW